MSEITMGAIPKHLMADDPVTTAKAKNVLGKDDFMKLLMTQLRHQDPLNPMDHKEMATNLAQFGSLEQLQNIGTGINALKGNLSDGQRMNALNFIGKKIQAVGNEIDLMEGQSVNLQFLGKPGVAPSKAFIFDANNKPVREILLAGKGDSNAIEWNGKDNEGNSLPSGKYAFRVYGTDSKGQSQDLSTELAGKVTGVDMQDDKPMLIVQTEAGKIRLEMNRIRSINDSEEKSGSIAKPANPFANLSVKPPVAPTEVAEVEAPTEPAETDSDEDSLRGFANFGGINR